MEKFKEIIQSETPVLVDFYATWCGPCKAMHPVIEQVKKELGDKVRIIQLDVDKYDGTALFYRIQMVPTFILFRKGEVLWRYSGVMIAKELKKAIEQYL